MSITALIPAHNESDQIRMSIKGLQSQTVAPSRIVVICDNCTDDTEEIARSMGVECFITENNSDKKAGALNQAMSAVLAEGVGHIICVDADTEVSPQFIESAMAEFTRDKSVGAVGGVFFGQKPSGLLETFQYNEYVRFARTIEMSGKTKVLSGTASIFRADVLRELVAARGAVYDPRALTEDMEVGLAIKTLGYTLRSPVACSCTTELMPTWKSLDDQRVRWYRGAIENLLTYGVTRVTVSYWGQQLMLLVSAVMLYLYISMTVLGLTMGVVGFSPFWSSVGLIFVVERVVTVWKAGWRSRLLALVILPELCYDLYLQRSFFTAITRIIKKQDSVWVHV